MSEPDKTQGGALAELWSEATDDDLPLVPPPAQELLTVPTLTVVPPKGETSKPSSRRASPARLPNDLAFRAQAQMDRAEILEEAHTLLPEDATGFSMVELIARNAEVDRLHTELLREHDQLIAAWPANGPTHEYFSGLYHRRGARAYSSYMRIATKLEAALIATERSSDRARGDTHVRARLPEIKLTKFKGDYSQWPAFRANFTSLVLDNGDLADSTKIQYLRGSLEGPPAHIVSHLPLTGESLAPTWELLVQRYENKRLQLQVPLDALHDLVTLVDGKPEPFARFYLTLKESVQAFRALGEEERMHECFLVDHAVRRMDPDSKLAWELSLGSSQEFPAFARLDDFLRDRLCALERVAQPSGVGAVRKTSTAKTGTSHPRSAQRSAHQGTAQRPAQREEGAGSTYSCDCCGGSHFIVACARFRERKPAERRQLVVDRRLCFNCLGRHSARVCRSQQGCKECSQRHHSMLHGASSTPAQQKDSSSKTESSQDTGR